MGLKGENMQVLSFLSMLSLFTCCVTSTETEVNQYCEEQCRQSCHICITPTTCENNQTMCGMGKPDPNFGGTCPPHPICVDEKFDCNFLKYFFC